PGPIRYAAAVDCALRAVLDADEGYSGLICKNPLNGFWRVSEWATQLYSLADLDGWLDLSAYSDRRKRLPDYGLGRNCNLFERLRHWAYRAIRQGWPDYDRWFEAVYQRAKAYNDFTDPLSESEVRHTARSVAKWTHQNLSPSGFAALQARRGGKKGAKRRDGFMSKVREMAAQGASQREIAHSVGVSQKTISNWIKR
ncbi:replication initiation protein, partial [uncultured Kushneria sp.]|uniref:replication initiation protein n=1 Tax=uncultured Kushneria sp. TaxID=905033 RepID=UPI002629419D